MFNLFKTKKITIPVDNAQTVTELQSWTIEWESAKHSFGRHANFKFNAKVFINKEEANEFLKQLEESAKFLNTDIFTKKIKN